MAQRRRAPWVTGSYVEGKRLVAQQKSGLQDFRHDYVIADAVALLVQIRTGFPTQVRWFADKNTD